MGDFAMISGRGRKVAAFTLIELMVVIAIVATLLVLLLPAITSAVEAGRRTRCGANASRLALAMTAYDGRNGSLPGIRNKLAIKSPGGGGLRLTSASGALQPGHFPMPHSTTNWFVVLLPHLELTPLFDQVVDGKLWMGAAGMGQATHQNLTKSVTECPSRGDFYALAYGGHNQHYRANASPTAFNKNDGAIGDNANGIAVGLSDISAADGASTTLLIAEGRRDTWYPVTWSDHGKMQSSGRTSYGTFIGNQGHNANPSQPFCVHPDPGASQLFGFPSSGTPTANTKILNITNGPDYYPSSAEGSFANQSAAVHPGGANVAFVDGSCRFLRDELPPHVYGHLLTHRSVWSGSSYSSNSTVANNFLKCPPASTPYMLQAKDY